MLLATSLSILLFAAAPAPPIVALAISPDAAHVVSASQAGVEIRSLTDLKIKQTLATELVQVHDLAFSPDAKLLAIVGGSPGELGRVEIWTWPEAVLKATLPAGGDLAYRVAWNADASQLAIAGGDRRVRIAPASGGEAKTYECHSAGALAAAWMTADDLVLSAGVDQSIRVLEPATGNIRRSLDNHTAAVRDLVIRPGQHDGPIMVASCSADRTVRFWQPTIGRLVRFVRLPSAPTALAWTPKSSHVLAASEDGKLRAIDPETIQVIEFAQKLDGVAFAIAALPDGSGAVLAGAAGQLRIIPLDAIKK